MILCFSQLKTNIAHKQYILARKLLVTAPHSNLPMFYIYVFGYSTRNDDTYNSNKLSRQNIMAYNLPSFS